MNLHASCLPWRNYHDQTEDVQEKVKERSGHGQAEGCILCLPRGEKGVKSMYVPELKIE